MSRAYYGPAILDQFENNDAETQILIERLNKDNLFLQRENDRLRKQLHEETTKNRPTLCDMVFIDEEEV